MRTVEEITKSSVSLNLAYSQPGALPRQDSSSGSGKQESNRRDGGEGVSVSHKKNEDHHLHDVIEAVSTPKAFGNVRTLGKVSISFEFFFFWNILNRNSLPHVQNLSGEDCRKCNALRKQIAMLDRQNNQLGQQIRDLMGEDEGSSTFDSEDAVQYISLGSGLNFPKHL